MAFFGPFFSGPKNDVYLQANFGSYYGEFVHISRSITTFVVGCDLSPNSMYQEYFILMCEKENSCMIDHDHEHDLLPLRLLLPLIQINCRVTLQAKQRNHLIRRWQK